MFNVIKKSIKFGEHDLILETGEIARQADGAVKVSYGRYCGFSYSSWKKRG